MAKILYEAGVKIGEISEWVLTERFPEKKTVLGKEIVTQKPKDQCTFISPKPVHWKKPLWIIEDSKTKLMLGDLKVKDGTFITATVNERVGI